MKILCIGRNYAAHIAEMRSETPDEPVIFDKPSTALLPDGQPFVYPTFSQDIHHEIELVLRVSAGGKDIAVADAARHYDAIGLGIDFTARDLQAKAKAKGLPWTTAKAFDGSAPIGRVFRPVSDFADLKNITFSLRVNGEERQRGTSSLMIHSFDEMVSYVSRYITLEPGDLLFTGTPEGVGPVRPGDKLEGFLENELVLNVAVQ